MKKSILIILLSILMIAALTSCSLIGSSYAFPDGYTGGVGLESELAKEPYILETYDEVASVLKQLEDNNSTFGQSGIVAKEIDGVDVKYSITFLRQRGDNVRYGDDPYSRNVKNVKVVCYVFFGDVEAEEISYSYFTEYNCYMLSLDSNDYDGINLESAEITYERRETGYSIVCDGEYKFTLHSLGDQTGELTQEQIESIIRSIVFIGFDQ